MDDDPLADDDLSGDDVALAAAFSEDSAVTESRVVPVQLRIDNVPGDYPTSGLRGALLVLLRAGLENALDPAFELIGVSYADTPANDMVQLQHGGRRLQAASALSWPLLIEVRGPSAVGDFAPHVLWPLRDILQNIEAFLRSLDSDTFADSKASVNTYELNDVPENPSRLPDTIPPPKVSEATAKPTTDSHSHEEEEETLPWWVGLLAGGSCLLLFCCIFMCYQCMCMKRRRQAHICQKEQDDHEKKKSDGEWVTQITPVTETALVAKTPMVVARPDFIEGQVIKCHREKRRKRHRHRKNKKRQNTIPEEYRIEQQPTHNELMITMDHNHTTTPSCLTLDANLQPDADIHIGGEESFQYGRLDAPYEKYPRQIWDKSSGSGYQGSHHAEGPFQRHALPTMYSASNGSQQRSHQQSSVTGWNGSASQLPYAEGTQGSCATSVCGWKDPSQLHGVQEHSEMASQVHHASEPSGYKFAEASSGVTQSLDEPPLDAMLALRRDLKCRDMSMKDLMFVDDPSFTKGRRDGHSSYIC